MDSSKNFYFLEMNTRLQVEHPVTELISGIDLVKEQINIALGHKLSFKQEDLKIIGHAIESRIYAEDPANNFLPATGIITEYKIPSGPGVRVDDGFGTGSEISVYYDPLISKLIVWAKDRTSTIHRMNRALSEYQITGLINNISFLKTIFSNEKFMHGKIDINFLEREIGHLIESSKENNILFEDAAAIISALIKEKALVRKKEDSYYSPLKNDNNNWSSLQYD